MGISDRALYQVLWSKRVRYSLNATQVYKGNAQAHEASAYFDSLRDKHLVHDENSYARCLVGALLNKKDMSSKIAKITALSVVASTLGQENYQNLHLLATQAREWVVAQFDALTGVLTRELEAKSYDELLAMDGITYTAPGASNVRTARPTLRAGSGTD